MLAVGAGHAARLGRRPGHLHDHGAGRAVDVVVFLLRIRIAAELRACDALWFARATDGELESPFTKFDALCT